MGKIAKIEFFHVEVPYPTAVFPAWIPGYSQYHHRYTVLSVQTTDGLTGWASCPALHRERAGLGEYLGPFLVGLDPYDLESVHERLRQAAFLGWDNSWVENAFWDLSAQKMNVPLHALIFERIGLEAKSEVENAVPAYASFCELRSPKAREEMIERAMRMGFRGAKVPVFAADEKDDLEQIRTARAAAGPEFCLMANAHQAMGVSLVEPVPRWTHSRAQRFLEEAAALNFARVEDPLPPEDVDGLRALCAMKALPIAGGHLAKRFLPLRFMIESGTATVLVPDASFAGLTAVVECIRAALAAGVDYAPSSNGGPLGMAANLHALAAYRRLGTKAALEFPWEPPAQIPEHRDALLEAPLALQTDGTVEVPMSPGVGVTVDAQSLRRYGQRFYHLTPVRFLVSNARRSGLRTAVQMAQRGSREPPAEQEDHTAR